MDRKAEIERFRTYIRQIADLIGLKDWKFIVCDDPPSDTDFVASINPTFGRKQAMICLGNTFLVSTPEDQRITICHELIHCHFEMACQIAEDIDDDKAIKRFRMMLEYGVDAVAEVVAPSMPLPLVLEGTRLKGRKSDG